MGDPDQHTQPPETCDCCRRRQIEDVLNRYARHIDAGRVREAVREVFTHDAVEDHGEGIALQRGWDAIESMLGAAVEPFCGGMHLNTNVTIELAPDGATATSHSYYLGIFWFQGPGDRTRAAADWLSAGQYEDSWVQTSDGWRIAHRRRSNVGLSSVVLGSRPSHLLAMDERDA